MDIYQIFITHNPAWTMRECIFFLIVFLLASVIVYAQVKREKLSASQAVAILLALVFLAMVFGSTVFTRKAGRRQYELELFWSWKEVLGIGQRGRLGSTNPHSLFVQILLNLILLVPLGFSLPFIRGKTVSLKKGLMVGAVTSFTIELLQLILCRGLFEFDDIMHNAIGCMAGCLLGSCIFVRVKRKRHI